MSALLPTGFVHRCHHHARRPIRRIRLTSFPAPSNPVRANRYGSKNRLPGTIPNQNASLQIGEYVIGDENCPFLYGPDDIRY
ncbi:hypothetical protein EI290_14090 [Hymenobacter metallilatus]|uniref:Uncharacterized protein n=1 Tax=Hymenobacter metallilatus TaxID=2493666 RepID=A0A428JF22_9BACT|nr:hypothetical protein EI290_14090 [Hymenobacter metallilatus]